MKELSTHEREPLGEICLLDLFQFKCQQNDQSCRSGVKKNQEKKKGFARISAIEHDWAEDWFT